MNTDYRNKKINSGTADQPKITLKGLLEVLISRPKADNERINLRVWFAGFLAYMVLLAGAVYLGLYLAGRGQWEWGAAIWIIAGMMFYLSLCCTLCPLPTTWLILAVGSTEALQHILGTGWAQALDSVIGGYTKVAVVAGLGGLATTIANLNEYHIFTFLLRYKNIGRVRQTRLYDWAAKWYSHGPFLLLASFCFIPIPVDVVRWLAISHRYPRGKFFLANMLGRGSRYALMVLFSDALGLGLWTILLIQAVLVLIAIRRAMAKVWGRRKTSLDADSSFVRLSGLRRTSSADFAENTEKKEKNTISHR